VTQRPTTSPPVAREPVTRRTQVGIIGAGPAGLVLSHLLQRAGIDCIVLENRSREYVEHRVRAGVLEQGTVDLLTELGVGERLAREGLVHEGIQIVFDRQLHRIPLTELTGRSITIYGQQEVVKDLIAARLTAGGEILFEAADVRLSGIDSDRPSISYVHAGRSETLRCEIIAGCDGFHGVSRGSIPATALTVYERVYHFAWLGVLASAPPSSPELIYASHPNGFALHSMRSPSVTRLYLQVEPDERLDAWPDERIWAELRERLAYDGLALSDGPILDRSIAEMRGFVTEPMQHGRLYLAGDAAHIVPATGAKGLNLAVSDVNALSEGLIEFFRSGSTAGLDGYSQRCLRRVWRVQEFSWYMSSLLHNLPGDDAFGRRLQRAELEWLVTNEAAARSLAENYVGTPFS
jgi:p-hydroxybenzoate 3-monooxygenase